MSLKCLLHAVAIIVAAVLIFVARVQDINVQPLTGPFDQRRFDRYTPYFSGLDALQTTTIFDPSVEKKKKIAIIGASTTDSIGCDYTWSQPEPGQQPNAHYSCSITYQLNLLLKQAGHSDWEAFDLARNGAKLTPLLYVYARLLVLRPEVVLYGEAFNYYMLDNAGAAPLRSDQYAYMDKIFGKYPDTAAIWGDYKSNLQSHGWQPDASRNAPPDISLAPQPRASTTLADLLVQGLLVLRTRLPVEGPVRPVAYKPDIRKWTKPPYKPYNFTNPDPGFNYFQGIKIIADMQRHLGNKMMFFFCPQWDHDRDLTYQKGLEDLFGAYLKADHIPFVSYVPMQMQPVVETYDGYHHTAAGNRKIAAALLHDLEQKGLLP